MNFDEWHEQAGRAAYIAWNKTRIYKTVAFDDLNELDQEAWREVARAVLGEGRIEFRRSPELAEQATREENERLVKIAREASEDVAQFRRSLMTAVQVGVHMEDAARAAERERDGLRKQVDQYHKSADEHVQKFDRKHEALVAVQRQLDAIKKIVFEDAASSYIERLRRVEDALSDDIVRACTGCGMCSYCKQFPRGLCGNRADHAPHLHDSISLGRMWCEADQSKRLPFAMGRKSS